MADLQLWRSELQQRYQNNHFDVPVPTLNLGYIKGDDNSNRICEECELHFDLRTLPRMDLNILRGELRDRLQSLFKHSAICWQFFSLIKGTSPMHTDEASPIVKVVEHYCSAHVHAVAFCTEGPYLNSLGIETIVLGPGDIAQAHQPDEFIVLSHIQPTVALIKNLIGKFCC